MLKSVRTAALTLSMTAMATFSGVHPSMAATYAYVGNAGSNNVSVFRLEPKTGAMEPVQTAAFTGVDKPGSSTPLAVTPDHRVLIAGVRSQPYMAVSFAIEPKTGMLKHIGNGLLADSMANIATDHTGRFLFSASYGGNKVAVNPIGANGVVDVPIQVVPTGLNAHAFLPDPGNRYVFATNLGSDQVLSFKFDSKTGALTPNDSPVMKTPQKSGPRHFVFHPNHKFVYLIHELNGDIAAYAYDAHKGSWHEIQRTTALPDGFGGKPWAADIHLSPNGKFLYASERTSSTIKAFKVDAASGKLTAIGSVPTEKQPRGFNVDPSGHYLAAVGELSDGMSVYRIDQQSGALTRLASYPTGKQPNWVEFVHFQ